jgi:hypothetical protein
VHGKGRDRTFVSCHDDYEQCMRWQFLKGGIILDYGDSFCREES